MRNDSDKLRRQNQNKRVMLSNFYFFLENSAIYEMMWENMVEPERSQMTV
jgi:hypothetical protein